MTYRQTDYPNLYLGQSGLSVHDYGCFAMDPLNALNLCGYAITPEQYFYNLNVINAFTSDGLLIWAKVTEAYPMVTLGVLDHNFVLTHAAKGALNHWWLNRLSDGLVIDPWTGSSDHPYGYIPVGTLNMNVVPSPNLNPVQFIPVNTPVSQHFDSFLVDMSPNQTYSDDVVRMQKFLTVKGWFQDAGPQDGWYGPKTATAVHNFQVFHGITNTTQFGWWYPLTRAAANADLSYLFENPNLI